MSTATDTTKSVQKKPKKDYKQELLEQIQKQYGHTSAVVMDKALKTQDKQIEQAMLEGGRTAEQIGQTKGIDFGSLDKPGKNTDLLGQLMQNQEQVKATGVTPQQPQQDMSGARNRAKHPLSLPTDTSEAGAVWKILNFLAKGEFQGAPTQRGGMAMSQVEQDSYALNNELKRKQLEQINQTGEIPTKEDLFSGIPENEQEDYLIKPVKQTIRGIVNTVPILERKKSLPAKQLEDLGNFENTQQDLSAVVDRLKSTGLQLGPGFSTRPGAISDMLGQIKGKDFAGIKADIGRNFQLYRKTTTGVAAGYPELNMLAPNYPKATDTNEVFIQKSIDVMKDIERNREIMLDHFNKGGYAVSKLRKKQEQTQEQPQQNSQQGWTQEKESRYQELLKKRGK